MTEILYFNRKPAIPYEELFMGSNLKIYKHKYYLAYTEKS